MYCPSCGRELKDGSRFCGYCGAKVEEAGQTGQTGQAAPAAQTAPVTSQQPPMAQPAPAPHTPGPLGAAWHDITSSQGWIKRVLLLMAMKCVPVLGTYVVGYNLQWGAAAARGDASPLPRGTFTARTFLMGLFSSVISLFFMLAGSVLWVLNLIPLLGWIAVFVINLFVSAFCSLTLVRMALFDSLREAGELSEIWRTFKGRAGSLVAAACLPGIIVTVAFAVVMVLLVFIMAASLYGGFVQYGMYGSFGLASMIGSVFAIFGSGVILFVLVYIFFSGLTEMWALRAVGHWIAANAPEWPAAAAARADAVDSSPSADAR